MSEKLNDTKQLSEARTMPEGSNISLFDIFVVLVRNRKLIFGFMIGTGLIAIAISFVMTPIFTSMVKVLPPQQQGSGLAAAMLGQLGGLAGAASSIAGLKNPNDLYVGMLKSRTVADNLINQFKLKERYDVKTMDDARLALDKVTVIESGIKDNLISIKVDDKDPKFAATLANAYVDELIKLTQTLAVSDASMRRLFYENQLRDAKERLADAEVALRNTQEKTGMIQPEGQVQVIITSIAQLNAAIAAKEVEIKAMQTFAAAQNPELLRAHEELRGLQAQLMKLEKNQPGKEGDFMVSTGNLPEAGVEYVRRLRDVKYSETLYEMLAKQYELAKIDESRDTSVIQILDKAVPAEHKSKPKRALIALMGIVLGGMVGVLSALARESFRRIKENPQNAGRWNDLLQAFHRSHSHIKT